MPLKLTQAIVEQWVSLAFGTFYKEEIRRDLDIGTTEGKDHLRVILLRLEQAGKIAKLSANGRYRKVDDSLIPIDWKSANPENIIPLKWPFELEKYALIYPKNVVIIAGSKQEGKTTFLYDFIKLNFRKYQIDLFNTETGAEQMKDRFMDLEIPLDASFNVYQRYDNFADVIHPDRISVIDYLDFNSEHYLAGAEIDAIFRKKRNGIAVIGMQIPPPTEVWVKGVKKIITRDYAYGAGSTAKRAFIYVSMSNHRLKLKHVKKPAQKNVSPENMQWSYDFDTATGQFINIQRYYGEEQHSF